MHITKIKINPIPYLFLVLIFLPSAPAFAQQAFTIETASSQLDDNVYFLNTVFQINLPGYIVKAVDQGFALPLSMEIEVFERSNLWFDSKVVFIRQQYRIQYHSLLDEYSVFDVNAGNRVFVSTLKDSVSKLSVLLNFPVLDNNNLVADEKYRARLRFGIDSNELPLPLKSSSLWKNNWDLVSDWYEWEINR
jgi:hypothetical protein